MKKLVRGLIVILMVLTLIPLSGCTLISVNPAKDNAEVIATIDGKNLYKSAYNNSLAMAQMNYEASDQQFPVGSDLRELERNIYDNLLQQNVFALQADKDGAKIDEKEAKTSADETLNQLREELGEDQFESILEQNYSNSDQFSKWLVDNQIQSEKASKTTEKFQEDFDKDPKKRLDVSIGKINDRDVTLGEYEYRLVGETLDYYMQNQSQLPADKMDETNEKIFEGIELTDANIKYCEDNGIEITDEEIKTAQDSLKQNVSYFFQDDEQKKTFLQNFYLTPSVYDEYQKQEAKGDAAEQAIQKKCEDDAKVTDPDIEKYYKDNEKSYDTSKVSAMHILSEDEDAANQVYEEAKDITKKEDFQKLVDKYKNVDNISEATDLGEFDYGTMVKEFSDAAFDAEPNTVLKPVKTQFGYHVIYVYDKKEGEVKPLDEVKDEIQTTLKQKKGQEEYDKVEKDIVKGVIYDIPDEIESPLEGYAKELESEYKVDKHENALRI